MRIRNKELRQRRHRKEQAIKQGVRVAKAEAAATKTPKAPARKKAAK